MAEIPYDEETTRDWSWYAVDDAGHLAEFTTGGFRRLPASVRSDWQRAEELIEYFDAASLTGTFSIRPEFRSSEIVTNDPATFRDHKKRERYFRSFTEAATRGLFSYDTELRLGADYYGVAVPKFPLQVSSLPKDIQGKLVLTRASLCFRDSPRVSEDVTLTW